MNQVSKVAKGSIEDAAFKYIKEEGFKASCITHFKNGAYFGYQIAQDEYDAGERARFIQKQAILITELQVRIRELESVMGEIK